MDTEIRASRRWTILTAVEIVAASCAIIADLAIPTLVLLAMAGVSMVVRGDRPASFGFRGASGRLAGKMLAFAAAWSVFQLAVTMPIANHLSGTRTDLSAFDDLQGNLAMLLGLLVLSWTLAAVGEELAYRGYLQTRMATLFGAGSLGVVLAVVLSSILFGIAHSEQGIVGVVVIALDGVAFSVVRYRHGTLWASVLAHGFNNTIGFIAFFFVGPIYSLW